MTQTEGHRGESFDRTSEAMRRDHGQNHPQSYGEGKAVLAEDPKTLLVTAERRLEAALRQLEDVTGQKDRLQALLDDIFNSLSWRITAPLRKVAALRRTIFPLVRNRSVECQLQCGRNIKLDSDTYIVTGPSPYLNVITTPQQSPRGWVAVSADGGGPRGHLAALLYFSKDGSFSGERRAWVTFEQGRHEEIIIKLGADTRHLRLDPFSADGEFTLRNLKIREIGTAQVVFSVFQKQFQQMRRHPGMFFLKLRRGFALLREGGLHALKVKLFGNQLTNNYQDWVEKYDTLNETDFEKMKTALEGLQRKPLISVVMPVYNPPERWLRLAIESVIAQIYPHWELCIADDNSSAPYVKNILQEYAERDSRIKVIFRDSNGHISAASNSALSLVQGEYTALLDHDDELAPHALYLIAHEINRYPGAGLMYSDEDKITSYGLRFNPYFKSSWNPELLLSQNYVCHLTVIRTDVVRAVGGFREGFDGAQDWDLVLRASERIAPQDIRHIPFILYHWRVIEGSTAQSTSYKPYVLEAQAKAVREHLLRRGVKNAQVEILPAISHLRVRWPVPTNLPLVSIIIPTKDKVEILRTCVESILADTRYPRFEIIIVDNGSSEQETEQYFSELAARGKARVIRDTEPFNFSRLNNIAAREAQGEILGFLNNDLEVISPDWLDEMVSYACRPEVGAVGARLLYPNDYVQHAGIILGIGGVAGHNHKGIRRTDPGYFNRAILSQNLSAVTAACMLMRREVFDEIDGFNEGLSVAFNDVDLCLRIRAAGYHIVYDAYAELYHYESASRGYENTPQKFMRFEGEVESMKKRWESQLRSDPYYNPNLSLLLEDFSFAFPPRVLKPWNEKIQNG